MSRLLPVVMLAGLFWLFGRLVGVVLTWGRAPVPVSYVDWAMRSDGRTATVNWTAGPVLEVGRRVRLETPLGFHPGVVTGRDPFRAPIIVAGSHTMYPNSETIEETRKWKNH